MSLSAVDIGRWLSQGGQIRLLRPFKTNGGVEFSIGDVFRLVELYPYEKSDRYGARFVSKSTPSKEIYLSSLDGAGAESFEFLI